MMLSIGIEQPTDHSLVLSVMFPRFALEEIDASLAHAMVTLTPSSPKDKVLRAREKVRNDLEISEWFVRVPDFVSHTVACLSANNRRRKSE